MDTNILVAIIGAASAVIATVFTGMSGVIWYFVTRDAQRVEKSINSLTLAVSTLNLTMKGIEVELTGLKEYVHEENKEQWGEINKVKDHVFKHPPKCDND